MTSSIDPDAWERAKAVWREAGFVNDRLNQIPIIAKAIQAAEQRGAGREREACAKVAEASKLTGFVEFEDEGHNVACDEIAAAIRARKG